MIRHFVQSGMAAWTHPCFTCGLYYLFSEPVSNCKKNIRFEPSACLQPGNRVRLLSFF